MGPATIPVAFHLQPTRIDIINLNTLLPVTEKRVYPTDDKFWCSHFMQLVQIYSMISMIKGLSIMYKKQLSQTGIYQEHNSMLRNSRPCDQDCWHTGL